MTLEPERRRALLEAKLGALVRQQAGGAPVVFGPFGTGAALMVGDEAWVLPGDPQARALGPALAWARQHRASGLHVVADGPDAGLLARRADAFHFPVRVWRVEGRHLVAAEAAPPPVMDPPDLRLLALRELIAAGGAEPLVEHGVLSGEVAGLEVCRAVLDPHLDVARLEVGVGVHDREAFQLIHGDVPPTAALADVVAAVAPHRAAGAPPHPLNRLAAERLLRHRLLSEPGRVGAARLHVAPPPVPRANLKDPVPCAAVGEDAQGQPVLVVCSVGVDLDAVPFAADARLAHGGPRTVLAVPGRDRHPVTVALADALVEPVEVVAVP